MKNVILIIVVSLILFSCGKNNIYQKEGTLTGIDYAMRPCCGGVILTIDNQSGNYRIDSLPLMSRQQLYNLNFPRRIKFNYQSNRTCGSIETIEITEYFMSH